MAFFQSLKRGWMAFVDVFMRVQNVILLTLIYHLAVGPVAFFCKLSRRQLLDLEPASRQRAKPTHAVDLQRISSSLEHATKQF